MNYWSTRGLGSTRDRADALKRPTADVGRIRLSPEERSARIDSLAQQLPHLLERRAFSARQIMLELGAYESEVKAALKRLLAAGTLVRLPPHRGKIFYSLTKGPQ